MRYQKSKDAHSPRLSPSPHSTLVETTPSMEPPSDRRPARRIRRSLGERFVNQISRISLALPSSSSSSNPSNSSNASNSPNPSSSSSSSSYMFQSTSTVSRTSDIADSTYSIPLSSPEQIVPRPARAPQPARGPQPAVHQPPRFNQPHRTVSAPPVLNLEPIHEDSSVPNISARDVRVFRKLLVDLYKKNLEIISMEGLHEEDAGEERKLRMKARHALMELKNRAESWEHNGGWSTTEKDLVEKIREKIVSVQDLPARRPEEDPSLLPDEHEALLYDEY